MRPRLAANYVLPTTEEDNDGRCLRSDLRPDECGLSCHRNSPDVPVLDDAPDIFGAAA